MTAFESALGALLKDGYVDGSEVEPKFMQDWARLPPVRPRALLRPKTVAEVSGALAICHAFGIPVVPQGGMTGFVGGGHPIAAGVVLSTERLTGIENLDPSAGTITVLAGTPLQTIQNAADAAGFFFPLDLGARGTCTIGGNLATNAGGNRVIRYGMARDMVVALEAVLADGTVVGTLHKMIKDNTAYDLKNLIIGSEGTLAVITRAVLRLQPKPLTQMTAFFGSPDFESVLNALRAARAAFGPGLTAFEAMWPDYHDLMVDGLDRLRRPLQGRHGVYVLMEVSGYDPVRDVGRFEDVLADLLDAGAMTDAVIAHSDRETGDFWATRDAVSEWNTVLGDVTSFDISFEVAQLGLAVDLIRAGLSESFPGIVSLFFGHVGDGNLHVTTHIRHVDEQPSAAMGKVIYGVVQKLGGSVSAEHGIGLTKKPYLPMSRSRADLAVLRTLKAALDPRDILNPGKVFDVGEQTH